MNEPWRCPSPGCKFAGAPSIHLLNLGPRHVWTVAQVLATLVKHVGYPFNWIGHEGD